MRFKPKLKNLAICSIWRIFKKIIASHSLFQEKVSNDNPLVFPKGGFRGGQAVTTPWSFPNERSRGGHTMKTPWPFLKEKA